MKNYLVFSMAALLVGASCNTKQEKAAEGFTGAPGEVKLITLDPGHFHAALVQKVSYPQVSKDVYVYAPTGFDVDEHLKRIQGFNTRAENPTAWNEIVYTGDDYLEKMLTEKKGNVMIQAETTARRPNISRRRLRPASMCFPTNRWRSTARALNCWRNVSLSPNRKTSCCMTS
ncbi:MAG: hypothetical protein ACLRS8_16120 [Parabacteroides merdae]